jgi:hypothetical protein
VDFDVLKVTHGFSYAIGTAQYPMKQQRYRGDANNGCAPALQATMWCMFSSVWLESPVTVEAVCIFAPWRAS